MLFLLADWRTEIARFNVDVARSRFVFSGPVQRFAAHGEALTKALGVQLERLLAALSPADQATLAKVGSQLLG